MLTMLSLYLFLQILQFCTSSSIYCGDYIRDLNDGKDEAVGKVAKHWESCGSVFLAKRFQRV